MAIASGLLACLMAATFVLLYEAIAGLRDSARLVSRSQAVLTSANRLERLVVNVETDQRGYLITRDRAFLRPWNAARAALPERAREFERKGAGAGAEQGRRAAEIARAANFYVTDHSVPVVTRAQRGIGESTAMVAEGERQVEALRYRFDEFVNVQRELVEVRQRHALDASRHATVTAVAAAVGSLGLILLYTGYLTRSIVRPVRRAAVLARELADGDLTVRMPEASLAELGTLEHAFNTMAGSLEASQGRLRKVADDQAALSRVATLVACTVSPQEVFEAVAGELGRALGADFIVINRFEADRMETVVGSWRRAGNPEPAPLVGSRWSLEGRSLEATVLRSGRPARWTGCERAGSGIGVWARTRGISTCIGSPVVVEGRLWGVIVALSAGAAPHSRHVEEHMMEFTGLVGTALANAESRAKLTAARARLVEASDETRRRIERDLHDGAQQRLVSLGLELRAAEAAVSPGREDLRTELSQLTGELTGVLEDLQEISRGLHPAILSRAGLEPALRALARRSAVPVHLDVRLARLEPRFEAAVYYIVREALTNAIEYARASVVWIDLGLADGTVRLRLRDDGTRGADLAERSGHIGIKDRVEALGGTLRAPAGPDASLEVHLPVPLPSL